MGILRGLQHRGTRRTTLLPTAQVVDGQARTQTLVDETDAFGHTTRHLDLSGTDYRYGYDAAARLVVQSGAAHIGQPKGQELRYTYFANGLLQSQIDVATGTRTDYGYDDAGQRVAEAYYKWNPQEIPPGTLGSGTSGLRTAAYQINRLSYDELGRVREVTDANYYRVRYEYDVLGNRRLVDATYADGLSGRTQTYWYRYDAMNRLLVSKGSLVGADGRPAARGTSRSDSGPRIEAGVDGVVLAYDALGQRTEAHYNQNDPARPGVAGPHIDEVYTYSADGFVQAVRQNGVVKLTRVLDEAGRTLVEKDHQNNTRTESTYNRADRLTKQVFIDFKDQDKNSETTFSYYTTVLGGDWRQDPVAAIGQGALAQTITHMTSKDVRVPDTVTRYGYDYWDDARQAEIVRSSSTGSGTTTLSYNANGFLVEEFDAVARIRTSFFNSGNGLILRRERQQNNVGVGEHQFFYADGKRVGDLRNDVSDNAHLSLAEELAAKGQAPVDQNELYKTFRPVVVADFDQNLDPINSGNPTGVPGSYTVRRGDTLTGVAQQLWGDASLWYLIAEANGLSGMESLSEGQLLRVPQQVTNLHNNSQVLRPYDPAEALGAVDPTVPPHRDRCGTLSQIIGVVVAAVVTFYGGPVGPYIAGAVGNMAQQYSNAAFNGELDYGDLFKRGIPLAFAAQYAPGLAAKYLVDHRKHPPGFVRGLAYDYQGTGVALAAGAVSGGVGSALSAAPDIVRAGASAFWGNATAQQLNRALGRQDEFDWRGLVSSTLAASASTGVSQYLGKTEFGQSLNRTTLHAAGNLVGGSIGQLILQRDRWDFRGVFASTLGSAIGDAILPGRPGLTNSERLRAMAASYASGDVGETVPVLGLEADDGAVGGFAGSLEDMMRDQAAQDLQGVEWNKYAEGSGGLGRDKVSMSQVLDAEQLSKEDDMRRNVRKLQALLRASRAMARGVGLSLSPEAAAAKQEFRRMEIEQLNAMAGAATTETTSNELTIHTSFPFPAERLPDSGFLRGYLLGQGELSVFDTHQPNLAENIGTGARGLVLMPFKAVTGLAGEVGSQYRDLYNLVAGPKNAMATSALYNSLQREGIGGTLGNIGLSVLTAPIQPVFDVLEGRYEQAGAGLPGMVSAGFGVVRGVRSGGYGARGNAKVNLQTGGRQVLNPNRIEGWDAAERVYGSIRADQGDIAAIAQNTGMPEATIARIKAHVFENEHLLDSGLRRFDADPNIVNAWSRLKQGDLLQSDLVLLSHERFESKFEALFKTNYRTAHNAAENSGRVWNPE